LSRNVLLAFLPSQFDGGRSCLEALQSVRPDAELWVVAEFAPPIGQHIAFYPGQHFDTNFSRIRWHLRDSTVLWIGVPVFPAGHVAVFHQLSKQLAAPKLYFNENGGHFRWHPRSAPVIFKHYWWRIRTKVNSELNPGGKLYTWWWRLGDPRRRLARPWWYFQAQRKSAIAQPTSSDRFDDMGQKGDSDWVALGEISAEKFELLREEARKYPEAFCITLQKTSWIPRWAPFAEECGFFEKREFLKGESGSYTLFGHPYCSIYSREKLALVAEGSLRFSRPYAALLWCWNAWKKGLPTIGVPPTLSLGEPLSTPLSSLTSDREYLRFVSQEIEEPTLRDRLRTGALWRINLRASRHQAEPRAMALLRYATRLPVYALPRDSAVKAEERAIALIGGSVRCFPGEQSFQKEGSSLRPKLIILSPYCPFPLSHGGAVRMFNLMRRAAKDFDLVLLTFTETDEAPAPELLAICQEVVMVKKQGSHHRFDSGRPDAVDEFDRLEMHGALQQSVLRWQPKLIQIEFTWMASYTQSCSCPTILVEHDITFDLWEQLTKLDGSPDNQRQLLLWQSYEKAVWKNVDCVAVMSEQDQARVVKEGISHAVVIANGVDCQRFQPNEKVPESRRLLFVGSFAHLPNLQALEFFLTEIWPLLDRTQLCLHVIGGKNHLEALSRYPKKLILDDPAIEIDGFVSDVRQAYDRAELVIAPLVASAGTNIKIMEAMAMGKAIVSSPAGINGLTLARDEVLVAENPAEFAQAIQRLLFDAELRRSFQIKAALAARARFDWDAIAKVQAEVWSSLIDKRC
jgi:glycosyltransferase involved in cell wall biosynthesis